MMSIKFNTALVFTIAIILATGIVVSTSLNSAAYAQNTSKFNAKLSGQEEVPPTQSKATGMAEFTPSGESVSYTVNATGTSKIFTRKRRPNSSRPTLAPARRSPPSSRNSSQSMRRSGTNSPSRSNSATPASQTGLSISKETGFRATGTWKRTNATSTPAI